MSKLKALSILAILEGISYLALFGITMPIKYIYEWGTPNYITGMAHGVLFILYCVFVLIVAKEYKWSLKTTMICLIASLLPIATFIVDRRIIKKETEH